MAELIAAALQFPRTFAHQLTNRRAARRRAREQRWAEIHAYFDELEMLIAGIASLAIAPLIWRPWR